jgi:hypothetical protein
MGSRSIRVTPLILTLAPDENGCLTLLHHFTPEKGRFRLLTRSCKYGRRESLSVHARVRSTVCAAHSLHVTEVMLSGLNSRTALHYISQLMVWTFYSITQTLFQASNYALWAALFTFSAANYSAYNAADSVVQYNYCLSSRCLVLDTVS